jgi:hypothetical protein
LNQIIPGHTITRSHPDTRPTRTRSAANVCTSCFAAAPSRKLCDDAQLHIVARHKEPARTAELPYRSDLTMGLNRRSPPICLPLGPATLSTGSPTRRGPSSPSRPTGWLLGGRPAICTGGIYWPMRRGSCSFSAPAACTGGGTIPSSASAIPVWGWRHDRDGHRGGAAPRFIDQVTPPSRPSWMGSGARCR